MAVHGGIYGAYANYQERPGGKVLGTITATSLTGAKKTFDEDNVLTYKTDDGLWVIIERGTWDMLDAIVPVILKRNPGSIVEIGMGESTEILAKHAEEAGERLYSCDLQMGGMFKVFGMELFNNHEFRNKL